MKDILIITTGGTFEKSYSEDEGLLANRESQIKQKLLDKLRLPNTDVKVKAIMAKDSLDMTPSDRAKILDNIKEAIPVFQAIIVVHGTDTLDQSLQFCEQQLKTPAIPIIFTGAMKPAGFDDSDALQNFTEALYAAKIVDPGYYLSFHGQLFHGTKIKKNKSTRTFEYI
ncbi:MAG: asparaginase [Bdellovibrionales bacterium]|nr:asparaginase [Bdellovibrionales bacterium]